MTLSFSFNTITSISILIWLLSKKRYRIFYMDFRTYFSKFLKFIRKQFITIKAFFLFLGFIVSLLINNFSLTNPLQPGVAFLYPWRFSDDFRGYRKATPHCNGLTRKCSPISYTPWNPQLCMGEILTSAQITQLNNTSLTYHSA